MTYLRKYMDANKIRQKFLMEATGISQSHISALRYGRVKPSLDVAWRIEQATGGAVTMQSWLDDAPDDAA